MYLSISVDLFWGKTVEHYSPPKKIRSHQGSCIKIGYLRTQEISPKGLNWVFPALCSAPLGSQQLSLQTSTLMMIEIRRKKKIVLLIRLTSSNSNFLVYVMKTFSGISSVRDYCWELRQRNYLHVCWKSSTGPWIVVPRFGLFSNYFGWKTNKFY